MVLYRSSTQSNPSRMLGETSKGAIARARGRVAAAGPPLPSKERRNDEMAVGPERTSAWRLVANASISKEDLCKAKRGGGNKGSLENPHF